MPQKLTMGSPPKTIFLVESDPALATVLTEVILLLIPGVAVETVTSASVLTASIDAHACAVLYSVPRKGPADPLASALAIRERRGFKSPMLILISGDRYEDLLRPKNPFDATLITPIEALTLQVLLEAATV